MAESYLTHSGVKGMKWGIRRYQNADGSLTEAGKSRYYGNKRYNRFLTKLPTHNPDRAISRDMRRGIRNAAVDTLRGTFSKKSDFSRKDARRMNRILPGAGTLVRNADTFSKQGFKDSMSRNKQAVKGFGKNASDVYGSEEWRKWKKRRIAKAAVAGTALAAIGGAAIAGGIAKSKKNKRVNDRISNANKQYQETQKTIEMIKSNPNSHHSGDIYARSRRVKVKK